MTWFEDMEIGARTDLGSYTFTAEKIIEFASAFDPQPCHLSEASARAADAGGLRAAGWHTGAVWMKLMIGNLQARHAAGGPPSRLGPSPGIADIRWIKPVYAGDTITYASITTDKKVLKSRPGWGLVQHHNEGINQHGDLVFSFTGKVLVPLAPKS